MNPTQQIGEHLLQSGFVANNFLEVTLTFHVRNQPREMLHLKRLSNNIHEEGAHIMKVFASRFFEEFYHTRTHLGPILTLSYLQSLSVQLLRFLINVGFRMSVCPYCQTHGFTWQYHEALVTEHSHLIWRIFMTIQ